MVRRKFFLVVLGSCLLVVRRSEAQGTPAPRRIGILAPGSLAPGELERWPGPLLAGLRERGWEEGRNLIIERRPAQDRPALLPDLAAELAREKVDVIVTIGTPAALAARDATSTIPIVMATIGDPVSAGLVTSLARPGGNITGNTFIEPDLGAKRLQVLRELLPSVTRVGEFINPTNPAMQMLRDGETEALRRLGVEAIFVDVTAASQLDDAMAELKRRGAQAMIVHSDSLFVSHRALIMELARKHRLPTMGEGRQFVTAGAIISYAPDSSAMIRNAAAFVDRILKGARAGDLPIERPTRFELVVNASAAKALGVVVPQSLLVRADEVIQ